MFIYCITAKFFMVPLAGVLTKPHEYISSRSSANSQGTISGNSESEDAVVNEGCTSSIKGYTPCNFWFCSHSMCLTWSIMVWMSIHHLGYVNFVFREWIKFYPDSEWEAEPFRHSKNFCWQRDIWWKNGSFFILYHLSNFKLVQNWWNLFGGC